MTSLVLSPNASGSGSLTIAAPNTASNITFNLPTTIGNAGTSAVVTTDASGNLGLGVTPSAWASQPAIQQTGGALWGVNAANYEVLQNAFYNGTNYIYRNTNLASRYNQNAGVHSWFTAPSGTAGNTISFTQAMTLDASGNLLVGATSNTTGNPKLYVNGAVSLAGGNSIYWDGTIRQPTFTVSYDGSLDRLTIGSSANTSNTVGSYIQFLTGPSNAYAERARITSGGDLLVGLTTPTASRTSSFRTGVSGYYCLAAEHSHVSNPLGLSILYTSSIPNGTGNLFLDCGDQTNQRAAIRSNGGIANYSGNNVNLSDRREKTNFAPAKSYLDTICAIPVQTFEYIDQSPDDPGLTLGVVAQDVQAVAPELVMESNWGTEDNPKMRLSIYQTDLQYALMKCIQEQQALITALTARVAALEAL